MANHTPINHRQLQLLLWASVMPAAAELLPGVTTPAAGRAAWLGALAAIPLVLAGGWGVWRLCREGPLDQGLRRALGPWLGGGVILAYVLWGQILLTLRLRCAAQRLLAAGSRDGSLWFFIGVLAAMALWMGLGRVDTLGRAGVVCFAALAVALGTVLALAAGQVRAVNLLPLWTQDLLPAAGSGLVNAGTVGWGIFAAFLLPQARPREGRRWVRRLVGGCVVLAVAQLVVLGAFGPVLTGELSGAFFVLAKSIGVEGAFQRVESVVTALWTLGDLMALAAILQVQRLLLRGLFPRLKEKAVPVGAVLLGAVSALAAFPSGLAAAGYNRLAAFPGGVIMGAAVPLLAAGIACIRDCAKEGGRSCREQGMSGTDIGENRGQNKKRKK